LISDGNYLAVRTTNHSEGVISALETGSLVPRLVFYNKWKGFWWEFREDDLIGIDIANMETSVPMMHLNSVRYIHN
jgi:hypothetical protein